MVPLAYKLEEDGRTSSGGSGGGVEEVDHADGMSTLRAPSISTLPGRKISEFPVEL